MSFFIISASTTYAQTNLKLAGSCSIKINPSTSLVIDTLVNYSTGSITCNGTLKIKGDLINQSGSLFNSSSIGTVSFSGSGTQQKITGTSGCEFYGTLDINNANGVSVTNTTTGANQEVHGTLSFTLGKLTLNTFNLTIGSTNPTGCSTDKYIVLNNTGKVIRNVPADGTTEVLFPIGNTHYNPITLINSATATTDDYTVSLEENLPGSWTGGSNNVVNRTWVVSEAVPGNSDLTLLLQWNSTEEGGAFDRSNVGIGQTSDNGATVNWGAFNPASGSDPYIAGGNSFTNVGKFIIGDGTYMGSVIELQIDLFLAGAFNTGAAMFKQLNTDGLIPTTDPYRLGTTAATIPADAIDWIKLELRDQSNHATVLYNFAFFVDVNGHVLNTDGTLNAKLQNVTEQPYYIAIQHRNHFGVVSSSTVDLAVASPVYDFSSEQAQVWQDGSISTNAAMKEVEPGTFGLWNGDANNDGKVQNEGGNPDRVTVLNAVGTSTPTNKITSTYSAIDVNMDGEIQYEGANPDRVTILNVVGTATPTSTYSVHLP